MGQWAKYIDPDHGGLPDGMRRVAYDADSECYFYRDSNGSIWCGEPGSRFGKLSYVSGPSPQPEATQPDEYSDANSPSDDRKAQMFAKDFSGLQEQHEQSDPPPQYQPSSRQFMDFSQLLGKKKHQTSESISYSMLQPVASDNAQIQHQSVLSKVRRSLSVKQAAALVRQRRGTL